MQRHNATQPPTPPHTVADLPEQEHKIGEAQPFSVTTNPHLRLLTLVINLLVISELFVAMYFAAKDPDNLTPIFFKIFFSLLVPTLLGAFIGRRLIARASR